MVDQTATRHVNDLLSTNALSLARPRYNLPQPLTSFVGRTQEGATVQQLLAVSRCVTLTGVGGSGKTRLALEIVHALMDDEHSPFPDGVGWVELAPLSDPSLVIQAVISTFGLHEQPDCEPLQMMIDAFAPKALLVVLDNCEYLAATCATLVDTLLRACPIMRWYRDYITQAPDDINGFFAFLNVPPGPPFPEAWHGKNVCAIVWCCTYPQPQAEEAFAPIRQRFPPAIDFVGPLPYPALQSMFDPLYPKGMQWYWRADFVNELSDAAIAKHIEFGTKLPSLLSTMHLYPINGAASCVGQNDTAWSYRESTWGSVIAAIDPDPASAGRLRDWAVAYWEALHPYSAGGAYVNMMMEEGQARVQAAYRDNYERLVTVKNKYDPNNLFRVNQNIKPTV